MAELPYSFHLGSNKNRKASARSNARNNVSGSSSLANNGIQNYQQLSKVNNHDFRKYENDNEYIYQLKGTNDIVYDVKEFYKTEFEEARLEYNNKQSRPSRRIDDYFEYVNKDEKRDLACEIIIELGNKDYWDSKDFEFKREMVSVYEEHLHDLERLVPEFKITNAVVHLDETSPHIHIVGVPVKYNCKTGMRMQVGKSDVFTKESLIRLQDKMRTLCIEEFNQVYSLESTLKQKQKGRNRDIHVSDMDNYIEMKKQIERNTENLKQANKMSSKLKQNSKDIKDKIDKLKISKLNKDNYILSKEDKDSFINYIEQVDNTSKEYDKIQTLSNTLVNAHEQLKDKNNKIKTLLENNEALNLRVKTLNDTIKEKDNEISFLKSKISDLKNTLNYWKDKFSKLISFLHDKLHSWYDKNDKYIDVVNDMYNDNVLDDDDIENLDLSKEKDDFER